MVAKLTTLSILTLQLFAQDHNKVNCNAQFQFAKAQIDISASYLQKITASLKLIPQTLAQLNQWTAVALDQQRALCDAYKTSSEQQFPASVYLDQLAQLRVWEIDFLKLAMAAQQAADSKATAAGGGKDAESEYAKSKTALSAQISTFLSNPPKAQIPGKS